MADKRKNSFFFTFRCMEFLCFLHRSNSTCTTMNQETNNQKLWLC